MDANIKFVTVWTILMCMVVPSIGSGNILAFHKPLVVSASNYQQVTRSVALADVNGDGTLDIVTARSVYTLSAGAYEGKVSVLLGVGDGTFRTEVNYATGPGTWSVSLADVNGDGFLDIATADYGMNGAETGTVSVLLGIGDGTFRTKVDCVIGQGALSVSLADVNGDGKQDIAVTYRFEDLVSVLLGFGNGTFRTKVDYATGAAPQSVSLADVNGDGKQDIVTANGGGNTSVLLGVGDGTFRTKVNYATGPGALSASLADVNGDGKQDIVTANGGGNTVSVLLGVGDGTFRTKVDYATGVRPASVSLADMNGDGKIDIVTANDNANTVSVLLGVGDGTFLGKVDYAVGETYDFSPSSVALADVNGDGKADIVIGSRTVGLWSVLISANLSTIVFSTSAPTSVAVGGAPYKPAASAAPSTSEVTFSTPCCVCSFSYGYVSFQSAGICIVQANALDDANFAAPAQATQTITVLRAATIYMSTFPPSSAVVGGASYRPAASAAPSSIVTFTIAIESASVCTFDGGVVSFQAAGTCVVQANAPPADATYAAPAQVTQTFTVAPARTTIVMSTFAPSSAVVGGAPYRPAASAAPSSSIVTFTIAMESASVCTCDSGVVIFEAAGTCVVQANALADARYAAPAQVIQTITVVDAALVASTAASFSASSTASSGSSSSSTMGSSSSSSVDNNSSINAAASLVVSSLLPITLTTAVLALLSV